MEKKTLILTIAKDIYLAMSNKSLEMNSLVDAVKLVEEAFNSIKD